MKILFVFKSHDFMVPRGLSIISAIARQKGHDTYLCEMNSENPLERITQLQPDIIAYSSMSGESKHYTQVNKAIKNKFPNLFTIMGGPHATFFPEVIDSSTLDAICIGEGDEAFEDVLDNLSAGKSVEGIANVRTRNGATPVRDAIPDLDSLPFPDYSLFYDNIPVMGKAPLKSIMASRGCPYNCTYCFNARWKEIYRGHGKVVRRHSVDYVMEDIERVRSKWPLSCVKFYDDVFVYSVDDWLEEFCRKYKKQIGLPFFILTRYDLLTEDMVKLLKEAGCRTISMSIEAGNPEIRNNVLKRKMSDEQILEASLLCDKYGIYTFTNAILALPGSTLKDDIRSIDLAIEAKSTWAEFACFYPYPGTELGDQTIQMGLYSPVYSHMHTSYQNYSMLSSFSDTEKRVQRNLGVLGPVAAAFPRLRNLILNHMAYWPYNQFFVFMYWVVKSYVLRRKIYYTKTNLWQSLRIYARSFKQEFFRHTREKDYHVASQEVSNKEQ